MNSWSVWSASSESPNGQKRGKVVLYITVIFVYAIVGQSDQSVREKKNKWSEAKKEREKERKHGSSSREGTGKWRRRLGLVPAQAIHCTGNLSRFIYGYISPWLRMLTSIHRVELGSILRVTRGWVHPLPSRRVRGGGTRLCSLQPQLHDSSAILFALFRHFNSRQRAGF